MAEGRSCVGDIGKRLTRRRKKSEVEIVEIEIYDSSSSSLESIVEGNSLAKLQ